ncbi:cell fate (sporulation/competence/biofilm development) regulator YmcA (YheA/YmcA/DUF963 family) [Geomicrobium halophilum]|uniref:Cell fate (Sporulation/competence/biofilm development) regulator YmcA (YheA/YmcA/DUF963 family) n=1 Tax=Geomicrobium halophilum TaxID=549000 RepID=A0A841PYH8_9BACL|nr:YlbF family regulator [Geomicrobium halophilum]MBB6449235.1 cell fate (sporulation/competence/biofilm development) regulator YmcA (YheA/YmcA/DUF963 family) [Geomicrobium halophilum]
MNERLYTKDEILDKAKDLGKMIVDTEEVDFFIKAEEKINQNTKIQSLIDEIKSKQKELVNLKHYNKSEGVKKKEAEINALHAEIDEIPLVKEFKQSQTDVNEVLQLVSTTISNAVTNEITDRNGKESETENQNVIG